MIFDSLIRAPIVVTAAQVSARLGDAASTAGYVFAQGQVPTKSGMDWSDRIGIFEVQPDDQLRLVLDCWMSRAELGELRARFPGAVNGGWDVMFATRWRYAWGGRPFRLSSRHGMIARVDGPRRVAIGRRGASGPPRELTELRAEIAPNWSAHKLAAVWADGSTTTLARRREWAARLDPTYDGLNLLADASWLAALSAEMAQAAAVPLSVNDPVLKRAAQDGT